MGTFENYEGQSSHIAHLRKDFTLHRQAHAYLFTGPRGTGKKSVAMLLAQTALCKAGDPPCGVCGPCKRVLAGSHPDVHMLEPEHGKRDISVGVMRDMLEQVEIRSFEGGLKFFIIPEADRMNPQAQNALLKTLEEPPEGVVFILVTDKPSTLLPTVVSRCRMVRFHPLTTEACAKRLRELGFSAEKADVFAKLSEGCVGQALEMDEANLKERETITDAMFSVHRASDIPEILTRYRDEKDKKHFLDMMESAVREILNAQATHEPLMQTGFAGGALRYAAAVPLQGGLRVMEGIKEARIMVGSNVAFASALESVLLIISEEYERWPW